MKHRNVARFLGIGIATLVVLGGGLFALAHAPAQQALPRHQVSTQVKTKTVALTLVIKTGGMLHQPGHPEFLLHNKAAKVIHLPANALVRLTIVNYDDGTAATPAPYNKVAGVIGTATENGQAYTRIASDQIAHTFTVTALGLNVPVPAAASTTHPVRVVVTFHTGRAQKVTWQCMAPCGSGAGGWGGAMVTPGQMTGQVVIG